MPQREDDEQEEAIPAPVEPSGKELTEKRKRQAASRQAAEKLWNEIKHNIQHPKMNE